MVRRGIAALPARAYCRNAIALIFLALCACAPELAPRGSGDNTPAVADGVFITRDGLRLPLRHWDVAKPRAIIVTLHGMSDYSQAFNLPGPWWAAHGISVYAYDQRGFGGAPNRGLWAGAPAMRADLGDMVDAARAKFAGVPVYALGESMGGAVVLTALASSPPLRVDGIILVAPAVWSREDMPLSYRAVLWLGVHVFPGMHVSGEGLHIWATDNLGVLRRLAHDPLYQHSARVDQVYGLVQLMDEARRAPRRMIGHPPILFLYGGNDQVIPAGPTQAVAKELGPVTTVIRYPNGYHMLLRDLEAEPRWNDVLLWIEKTNPKLVRTVDVSGHSLEQHVTVAAVSLGDTTGGQEPWNTEKPGRTSAR
jgi:acylglycerol lipase